MLAVLCEQPRKFTEGKHKSVNAGAQLLRATSEMQAPARGTGAWTGRKSGCRFPRARVKLYAVMRTTRSVLRRERWFRLLRSRSQLLNVSLMDVAAAQQIAFPALNRYNYAIKVRAFNCRLRELECG